MGNETKRRETSTRTKTKTWTRPRTPRNASVTPIPILLRFALRDDEASRGARTFRRRPKKKVGENDTCTGRRARGRRSYIVGCVFTSILASIALSVAVAR